MSQEEKQQLIHEAVSGKTRGNMKRGGLPRPLADELQMLLPRNFQKQIAKFRTTSDPSVLIPLFNIVRRHLRTKEGILKALVSAITTISGAELSSANRRKLVLLASEVAESEASPRERNEEIAMSQPDSGLDFTSKAVRKARDEIMRETPLRRAAFLSKPIPPDELFTCEATRKVRDQVLRETAMRGARSRKPS